ncbi:MAG: hypothetical protein SGJ02_06120 [bacterium]|nr:hypothetical protein [bacterium]
MDFIVKPIIFFLCLALTSLSLPNLKKEWQSNKPSISEDQEVLYLPKGPGLTILSFGYQNLLADIIWFNTVSYFGKHYKSDQQYKWLFHMCDLVTTLNKNDPERYIFCGLMLGWEAKSPNDSFKILSKAIRNDPNSWKYYYLRGLGSYLLQNDFEQAIEDFLFASKLPDAPIMLASIAAKKLTIHKDDPQTAITFLEEMLKNSNDTVSRSILEKRLFEARKKMLEKEGK